MSNLPKILKTKTPRMVTRRGSSEVDITQKFIPIILLIALLFPLFSKPIQAFVTPNASYQLQFEQAIQTPEMNLQSFVYETLKATAGSVVITLFGCVSCNETERRENPGLIVMTGGLIANIYANPPASGVQYLAHLGDRLGVVRPVYAQERGVGFEAMRVILPIWKAFRNLSYLFFVLILVGLGFAIMFRVKISPQAVIGIQSALPRIIVALLLITFSYAIAGFLIDLMIILCILIASIFRETLISQIADIIPAAKPLSESIVQFFNNIFTPYGTTIFTVQAFAMGAALTTFLTIVLLTIVGIPIGALIGGVVGAFGGPATASVGAAIGAAAGPIFAIILAIILFIIFIRCLLALLKAYIGVLLGIIFAPLQILVGVLPGSNAIDDWFRNLIANLTVLPVMFTLFLLASFFSFVWIFQLVGFFFQSQTITQNLITAALEALAVRNFNPFYELFITAGIQGLTFYIMPIVGLGILFLAPRATEMIQAFITAKPFAYGVAIGETIKAPFVYPYKLLVFAGEIGKARRELPGGQVQPPAQPGRIP